MDSRASPLLQLVGRNERSEFRCGHKPHFLGSILLNEKTARSKGAAVLIDEIAGINPLSLVAYLLRAAASAMTASATFCGHAA